MRIDFSFYIPKMKDKISVLQETVGTGEAKYKNGMSYEDAKKKLLGLLDDNNQTILKSKDGEEARLSRTSIGKLISNDAVRKSMNNGFTREQHYAAASDISDLFENSIKVWEHPDEHGNSDVVAMHRFAAPLFGDNAAYITVKEATEHGKRIYTVELIETGKLEGMLEEAKLNFTNLPASSLPIHKYSK